jgi:hypothetical protein
MDFYNLKKKYFNPESKNLFESKYLHFLFLSILSLNYIVPLLLFEGVTLFFLDALDNEIIINHIISQRYQGISNPTEVFLNGIIPLEYMRRLYHPYMLVYAFLNTELAYWVIDILVKLTSYFSFFIFAKKINNNLFICSLLACLFASINLPTHEGFGLAITPYLFYLILFKKELSFKHYSIIIFFGLNSDFIFTAFAFLVLSIVLFLFASKSQFIKLMKVLSLFSISLVIANWNLLYLNFQNIEFHRVEFVRDSFSIIESIIYYFTYLIKIPTGGINYSFFMTIPYVFFLVPLFLISFFSDNIKCKKIISIIILATLFQVILKINYVSEFINQSEGILKTLSWDYISRAYIFLYCFALVEILKKKDNFQHKAFTSIIFLCIIFFQINSSIVPFAKDKILKIDNYRNIYTFKGYYDYYDYQSIKEKVGKERIISVGLDPLLAAYHGININDGYHNLYPLHYKNKFRKIIVKQLDNKPEFKNYYDNYGSRLYTFLYGVSDPDNINLNFEEAKKLNTKFVLSKYQLYSEEINLIFGDCEKEGFCLYKIK